MVCIHSFCDQKIYYVGSSNDVTRRLFEHQTKQSNFTHKFSDIKLVYQEKLDSKAEALKRETQIKRWPIYMIMDRMVIWEWAQRNQKCWWNPEFTFRQWVEKYIQLDDSKLSLF